MESTPPVKPSYWKLKRMKEKQAKLAGLGEAPKPNGVAKSAENGSGADSRKKAEKSNGVDLKKKTENGSGVTLPKKNVENGGTGRGDQSVAAAAAVLAKPAVRLPPSSTISLSIMSNTPFESLRGQVADCTLDTLKSLGFTHMTEIQAKTIPALLDGWWADPVAPA